MRGTVRRTACAGRRSPRCRADRATACRRRDRARRAAGCSAIPATTTSLRPMRARLHDRDRRAVRDRAADRRPSSTPARLGSAVAARPGCARARGPRARARTRTNATRADREQLDAAPRDGRRSSDRRVRVDGGRRPVPARRRVGLVVGGAATAWRASSCRSRRGLSVELGRGLVARAPPARGRAGARRRRRVASSASNASPSTIGSTRRSPESGSRSATSCALRGRGRRRGRGRGRVGRRRRRRASASASACVSVPPSVADRSRRRRRRSARRWSSAGATGAVVVVVVVVVVGGEVAGVVQRLQLQRASGAARSRAGAFACPGPTA